MKGRFIERLVPLTKVAITSLLIYLANPAMGEVVPESNYSDAMVNGRVVADSNAGLTDNSVTAAVARHILNSVRVESVALSHPQKLIAGDSIVVSLTLRSSTTAKEFPVVISAELTSATLEIKPVNNPLGKDVTQSIVANEAVNWQWSVSSEEEGRQRLRLIISAALNGQTKTLKSLDRRITVELPKTPPQEKVLAYVNGYTLWGAAIVLGLLFLWRLRKSIGRVEEPNPEPVYEGIERRKAGRDRRQNSRDRRLSSDNELMINSRRVGMTDRRTGRRDRRGVNRLS